MSLTDQFLEAVKELVKATGHEYDCAFAGCTCGAIEELKTWRLEVNRLLRRME